MYARMLAPAALFAMVLTGCEVDSDPGETVYQDDLGGGDTSADDTGGGDTSADDTGDDTSADDTGGGDTSAGDTGEQAQAGLPAEVLNLTDWKLTLPVPDGDPNQPLEIEQPELSEYSNEPWFGVSEDGHGVVFRANAGGTTTSGSSYPRSELREMTNGGAERANWSTTSGVHTMTITQAVTHLPDVKQHVVVGQIHDAEDDVVMIRLENERLYVEGGGVDLGLLDDSYTLGEEFTVRIVAANGRIDVYHQDMTTPAVSVDRVADGCYFKAGIYTQSNTERGDSADAYGEAVLRDLVVTHE